MFNHYFSSPPHYFSFNSVVSRKEISTAIHPYVYVYIIYYIHNAQPIYYSYFKYIRSLRHKYLRLIQSATLSVTLIHTRKLSHDPHLTFNQAREVVASRQVSTFDHNIYLSEWNTLISYFSFATICPNAAFNIR